MLVLLYFWMLCIYVCVQVSPTEEDICSMVPLDVEKVALCETAVYISPVYNLCN